QTQAQNAADAAATAAARTLNGASDANRSAATAKGVETATANMVLGESIQSGNVTVEHGSYHYDEAAQRFVPPIPPVSPDRYNLSRVPVTLERTPAFARVLGIDKFTVTAQATATHRPRDLAIILDFSGSMNNESDLWNNESYLGTANNSSNNLETVF